MGFLQDYLGLEPAYKDGYDVPLLGMLKWLCIKIGRALTASDRSTKGKPFGITGCQSTHNVGARDEERSVEDTRSRRPQTIALRQPESAPSSGEVGEREAARYNAA